MLNLRTMVLSRANIQSGIFVDRKQKIKLLILSTGAFWLLVGFLIPSNIISSSPVEFSNIGGVSNPIFYLGFSLSISFGIAVFWPVVIYLLFDDRVKTSIIFLFSLFSFVSVGNILLFSGDYGTVNSILQFDNTQNFSVSFMKNAGSFVSIFVLLSIVLALFKYNKMKFLSATLLVLVLSSASIGAYNAVHINNEYLNFKQNIASQKNRLENENELSPIITLSKTGKNIVVLFIDRAIGSYFPYILRERPELNLQFSGFTYFPNMVSFGRNTMTGAPPILGGYEYTPENMNKRSNIKLVDKHNEALLVLPRIFLQADYNVTVTDPPLSNYAWKGDHTPFFSYPEIKVTDTIGKYNLLYQEQTQQDDSDKSDLSLVVQRNLPFFSFMTVAPPLFRSVIYDDGQYLSVDDIGNNSVEFMNSYAVLHFLPDLTRYVDSGDTYTFIDNGTTHEQQLLIPPSYTPGNVPESIISEEQKRLAGLHVSTYHVNIATYLRFGEWFEELRKAGVYDNTRIIIVSDHGFGIPNPLFENFKTVNQKNVSYYNAVLLFKDFGAKGPIAEDTSFMTSADVPLMAIKDLPVSNTNPFTGNNLFDQQTKSEVNVYSGPWAVHRDSGNSFKFDLTQSFSVKDDITVESNWEALAE